MAKSVDEIMADAMQLSGEQRSLLLFRLEQETVSGADGGEISKEWMEEAYRRAEELRTGKVAGIPADIVMARIRAALQK